MSKLTLVFSPLYHFTSPMINPPNSALQPLSIISLPVPVLLPRAYSKIFVGGLSWDTTDGTLSLPPFLHCHVHLLTHYSVRWWRVMHSSLYLCLFITRRFAELFSEFGKVDACTIVRDTEQTASRVALGSSPSRIASVNTVMIWGHLLDGKAVRAPT